MNIVEIKDLQARILTDVFAHPWTHEKEMKARVVPQGGSTYVAAMRDLVATGHLRTRYSRSRPVGFSLFAPNQPPATGP